jgi:hypothetical protein
MSRREMPAQFIRATNGMTIEIPSGFNTNIQMCIRVSPSEVRAFEDFWDAEQNAPEGAEFFEAWVV